MNFDQLDEYVKDHKIKDEELFLDLVYETWYYPEFLSDVNMIDGKMIQEEFWRYLEEKKTGAIKHIEAIYMIDPIITPSKKK